MIERRLDEPDRDVGQELARHQLRRRHRRRDEELEIAALALAHDRARREDHHRHRQDHAAERRHDLHGRALLRVVGDHDLDRPRGRRQAGAAQQRHRSRAPQPRSRAPAGCRRRGSASPRRLPSAMRRSTSGAITIAMFASPRCISSRSSRSVRGLADLPEHLRRAEVADQPPRQRGLRLVEHRGRDAAHVEVDRIAEQQELDASGCRRSGRS